MTKGYNSILTGFRRVNNRPLEDKTLFDSEESASDYAKHDETAYPGQIISVVNGDYVFGYIIEENKSITKLSKDKRQFKLDFNNKTELTIEHKEDHVPQTIMIVDGVQVVPKVDYIDDTHIRLSWNGSLSGTVYLI